MKDRPYEGAPTQELDPARYDPADPLVGGPTDEEVPEHDFVPMAVEFTRPPVVVLEQTVGVREQRADDWAAWRVTVTGEQIVMIAGRHPGRRSLHVENVNAAGGADLHVGSRPSFSADQGSLTLDPGATLDLESTGPVYAMTGAGQTVTVQLVAEYDLTVKDAR